MPCKGVNPSLLQRKRPREMTANFDSCLKYEISPTRFVANGTGVTGTPSQDSGRPLKFNSRVTTPARGVLPDLPSPKARKRGCPMLREILPPTRRFTTRIKTSQSVWVYWRCNGLDEASRVRDLSLGGLFVETAKVMLVGSKVGIDFLVQEGQIRAEAVVRRVEIGRGLGLKFTCLKDKDIPHLVSLMNRLRNFVSISTTRVLSPQN
jgi:PilZ domain